MAMHGNGSEAYDLSLFEERPAKLVALEPNKKVLARQHRRTRLQTAISTTLILMVASVVIAVVGLAIFTRARITEVNDRIISQQEELKILESETIRLNNELAGRMSAEQVDDYAAQSGMQKMESYQIRYISVEDGDKIEVPDEGEKGFLEKIGDAVNGFFDWVAYLFR